jgi:type III secretory pathway component EscS
MARKIVKEIFPFFILLILTVCFIVFSICAGYYIAEMLAYGEEVFRQMSSSPN